jgi:hypothetical protein
VARIVKLESSADIDNAKLPLPTLLTPYCTVYSLLVRDKSVAVILSSSIFQVLKDFGCRSIDVGPLRVRVEAIGIDVCW